MRIVMPKINASEQIFFISYTIYLFFSILSTSFYLRYFNNFYSYIVLGCLMLLLFNELIHQKYTLKMLFFLLLFMVLALFDWFLGAHSIHIISMLAFVFCSRRISFEKISFYTILISIICVGFIILSSYFGIIQNYVNILESRTRYYLGFRYSLFSPMFLFNITALVIYIKKNNIKWRTLLLLFLANYYIFVKTVSRLSFGFSVILIIIAAILKLKPNITEKKKIIWIVLIFSFIICFFISLYLTVNYNPNIDWHYQMNKFFGHRLLLGQKALKQYGVHYLGQRISLIGAGLDAYGNRTSETYNYVDSLYIQILLCNGILFTAFYLLVHTLVIFICYKRKDYYLIIILALFAGRGLIDDLALRLYYNTFWFIIGTVLVNDIRKKFFIKNKFKKNESIKK